jgi:very-short-patch-repair endonuclease
VVCGAKESASVLTATGTQGSGSLRKAGLHLPSHKSMGGLGGISALALGILGSSTKGGFLLKFNRGSSANSVLPLALEKEIYTKVPVELRRKFKLRNWKLIRFYACAHAKRINKLEKIFIENMSSVLDGELCLYQVPLFSRFISDFVIPSKSLVIEIDGLTHEASVEDDEARDLFFKACGFEVLRLMHWEWPQWKTQLLEKWDSLPLKSCSKWLPVNPHKLKVKSKGLKPKKARRVYSKIPKAVAREQINSLLAAFSGEVRRYGKDVNA